MIDDPEESVGDSAGPDPRDTAGTPPGDGESANSASEGRAPAAFLETHARAAATPPVHLPPGSMLNMELGQLAFAERVLDLAADKRTPLLERARFTAIFGSILDEFFMTRVAGFRNQVAEGRRKPTLDGVDPITQLTAIQRRTRELSTRARGEVVPRLMVDLLEFGIEIAGWNVPTTPGSGEWSDPMTHPPPPGALVPLSLRPGDPPPHVRNLRPAFLILMEEAPVDEVAVEGMDTFADPLAAVLELPGDAPRLLALPGGRRFMPLEEIVRARLQEFDAAKAPPGPFLFRVARGGNLRLDPSFPGDVIGAVTRDLARRPFRPVVRVDIEEETPTWGRELLLRRLANPTSGAPSLDDDDVYPCGDPIDLRSLSLIAELPIGRLHFPRIVHGSPLRDDLPVIEQIRDRDALIHFPHHSFSRTIDRFLREASEDPLVEEVWITLYRTNRPSRAVRLLRHAHRMGKAVTAVVEVKASFDEKQNIEWARMLEADGIRVLYGSPELKVHAKIASVVRREGDGRRFYSYVGTGNLNAATARAYTDLGVLTGNPEIGRELHALFRTLAGDESTPSYDRLLVAPFNLRSRIIALIDRETSHARAGRPASITAKLNGLADRQVIAALYRADHAGVSIDLLVRGICSLRPGLPGLSSRTRVVARAGPFLEHARILRFENDGDPEYFIGSADLRGRNLSRRVEVVTDIVDSDHRAVLDRILREGLDDPHAWDLGPDGRYVRRSAHHEPHPGGFSTLITDPIPAARPTRSRGSSSTI